MILDRCCKEQDAQPLGPRKGTDARDWVHRWLQEGMWQGQELMWVRLLVLVEEPVR